MGAKSMESLKSNLFLTREAYLEAFETIMTPLKTAILTSEKPGVNFGSSGAVYDQQHAEMEALIRPLWGIGPYWVACKDDVLRDAYVEKLIAGTDPSSPDYWGDIVDYDQYIVEAAALSLTLLLHKTYFWSCFSEKQQENIMVWLNKALGCKIPKNNWTFFKVLIRLALEGCGQVINQTELEEELALIERMYLGDGWYMDGKTTQRDYYISFAFHYYSLIYVKFMRERDPIRAKRFTERAVMFAQDYLYYFDEEGEALPYGRSQTYRFAQGAFFAALIFAEVEALPWGQIKTLLAKHLHCWMQQTIFTYDGRLSIGYHYENLVMAEGYNAPGSPYWAFKTFLLFAVDQDHPFWRAEPLAIKREEKRLIEKGNMLLIHPKMKTHVLGYPAGLWLENQAHAAAKYSKFVYSSRFGFSVPKAGVCYEEGAFDNVLAVSRDGEYFRVKGKVHDFYLTEEQVYYKWLPFQEVEIETTIYPFGEWHVRVHEIVTSVPLKVREGGFSLPLLGKFSEKELGKEWARVDSGELCSQIIAIEGYDHTGILQPEPNTSLFFPRTSLPYLQKELPIGTHRLICLVGGVTREE
ncbi:DUF2264 domain-containing protein [Enterococcus faecalis]|uniref:DUF2264 domain-containing protein n=1 Tax=Enterococcus faecalis TaxID=1351 RepID=UPI00067E884C|nr:DUF2264 domain-containing protein [Enterococcus faecalis]EGO5963262.1 DUF2264 domain-containing protein [Enterococcus faecalis]